MARRGERWEIEETGTWQSEQQRQGFKAGQSCDLTCILRPDLQNSASRMQPCQ